MLGYFKFFPLPGLRSEAVGMLLSWVEGVGYFWLYECHQGGFVCTPGVTIASERGVSYWWPHPLLCGPWWWVKVHLYDYIIYPQSLHMFSTFWFSSLLIAPLSPSPSHTHTHTGTSIPGDVAQAFAAATSSSVSLHDLSVASLAVDYDPFMGIRMFSILIQVNLRTEIQLYNYISFLKIQNLFVGLSVFDICNQR